MRVIFNDTTGEEIASGDIADEIVLNRAIMMRDGKYYGFHMRVVTEGTVHFRECSAPYTVTEF